MSISDNLQRLLNKLPEHVELIAVSKTQNDRVILEAYNSGQISFGENRVQEMVQKQKLLPKDIQWHMIGKLQTNKVKYISSFVHLIHSVDSIKLWKEIEKQGKKINRIIPCLLQIKIAKEETKSGMGIDICKEILYIQSKMKDTFTEIKGLMGLASFSSDQKLVNKEFDYLNSLKQKLNLSYPHLQTLSMGMSGDFELAIANGSNMVRLGSCVFGERKIWYKLLYKRGQSFHVNSRS